MLLVAWPRWRDESLRQDLPESAEHLLLDQWQHQLTPWTLQRAVDKARRAHVHPEFHLHDLRHYLASLLIASGADVKVVKKRFRHASAKTTLDTYGHLWPDSDDSTRAAIDDAMAARAGSLPGVLQAICGQNGAPEHKPAGQSTAAA